MLKRYALYLIRWQLSTPILAFCVAAFAGLGNLWATIIANFIGGLIFFWIDRIIFTKNLQIAWEVKQNSTCSDCGKTTRVYRLVLSPNYNHLNDPAPKYRCECCSISKADSLSANGVVTE